MSGSKFQAAQLRGAVHRTIFPPTVLLVAEELAARVARFENVYGGAESVARSIERRTGARMSTRSVKRSLRALKAERLIAVSCCAGACCKGGRRTGAAFRGHAARLTLGAGVWRKGWSLRGRFSIRDKGDRTGTPPQGLRPFDPQRRREEASPRLPWSSGDALRPPPNAVTGADGAPSGPGARPAGLQCRYCGVQSGRERVTAFCAASPDGFHRPR